MAHAYEVSASPDMDERGSNAQVAGVHRLSAAQHERYRELASKMDQGEISISEQRELASLIELSE